MYRVSKITRQKLTKLYIFFIIFNECSDFISILHENLGYIFGKERNKFQLELSLNVINTPAILL